MRTIAILLTVMLWTLVLMAALLLAILSDNFLVRCIIIFPFCFGAIKTTSIIWKYTRQYLLQSTKQ